jgi:hypothetical protein
MRVLATGSILVAEATATTDTYANCPMRPSLDLIRWEKSILNADFGRIVGKCLFENLCRWWREQLKQREKGIMNENGSHKFNTHAFGNTATLNRPIAMPLKYAPTSRSSFSEWQRTQLAMQKRKEASLDKDF